MKSISVKNLSIYYREKKHFAIRNIFQRTKNDSCFIAVDNVSFEIDKGEIIGLIGINGSGKSTLIKAVGGVYSPDRGNIDTYGQKTSILAIGAGFIPEMSGRRNIYISGMLLGFSKEYISEMEEKIIEFADIGQFIDKPVKTYSSGMYSRLAFSITAFLESDIVLIDEVLSVGDEHFRKKSEQRMRELVGDDDRTVMIVSHSLEVILKMCNRTIWMNNGKIESFDNTQTVVEEYRKFTENLRR